MINESVSWGGDGSSTDDGKRKREDRYDGTPFAKNKKLVRTTSKPNSAEERRKVLEYDELKNMMTEMMRELKELRNDQKSIMEEVKQINEETTTLRKENRELKDRMKVMEEKLEKIEKQNRKNNIIIKGIDFQNKTEGIEQFCKERLGTEVKIEAFQNIGTNERPMIMAKVNTWEQKVSIMKNKNKLRGTKIFVDHDMTKAESEVQKKLRERAKVEKSQGKEAHVGYQKIYINGECWKWAQEYGEIIRENVRPKN